MSRCFQTTAGSPLVRTYTTPSGNYMILFRLFSRTFRIGLVKKGLSIIAIVIVAQPFSPVILVSKGNRKKVPPLGVRPLRGRCGGGGG